MKKTKEHIKRFLSTVRPASEKDECMIRVFFNKRKIKLSVVPRGADAERLDTITAQMMAVEGVTEELKRTSQMEWVQAANSIHSRAEEIILHEMIYV